MTFLEHIDPVIRHQTERWNVPGVAVGLLHDGHAEFVGHGIANIETGAPVAPETLFQVGSISKVFTATLLMTLVDEGRIDIEAPIVRYVPELSLSDPAARENITVRHLLTHMSGFYGDRFDPHGEGDDALERAIAALADLPQQTAPGEMWTYCNAGYDLLGYAMQRLLGMPFEVAMLQRVFEPLGLERTTYFARDAILHSVAVGHTGGLTGEEPRVVAPWPVPRRTNPAGGVVSNVVELLRFSAMHLNDGAIGGARTISAESARAMRTIQIDADHGRSWGFGWLMHRVDGTHTVEHGGATNGFTARLVTVPERTFAIAILTNSDNGSAVHSAISSAALKQFLGLSAMTPATIRLDEDGLARMAGHFRHGLADIDIRLESGGLVMYRTAHEPFRHEDTEFPPARVEPISPTEFLVVEGLFEGSVGEVFFDEDDKPRLLRMGGRLGYPVT
jgi:CubicO group peptidase (beta-lactamase class C family)